MNTDFELCCWQRYWCCWQRVCGVCPLGEVSCRRMGAVVMIFEVSICWCSTAVTAVGCSDALEPGGSRGVVCLPLWAVAGDAIWWALHGLRCSSGAYAHI